MEVWFLCVGCVLERGRGGAFGYVPLHSSLLWPNHRRPVHTPNFRVQNLNTVVKSNISLSAILSWWGSNQNHNSETHVPTKRPFGVKFAYCWIISTSKQLASTDDSKVITVFNVSRQSVTKFQLIIQTPEDGSYRYNWRYITNLMLNQQDWNLTVLAYCQKQTTSCIKMRGQL